MIRDIRSSFAQQDSENVHPGAPDKGAELQKNMANPETHEDEQREYIDWLTPHDVGDVALDDIPLDPPQSAVKKEPSPDPDIKAQHDGRNYCLHPITDRFPEMSEAAFEELKADIRERGQLVPIVALPNSQIIDGKHRFRACQELRIPPVVEVYTGPQTEKALFAYVRGLNARRRHLTAEELQAFAVMRTSQGASQRQIAREAGVSQPAISKSLNRGGDNQLSLKDSATKSETKSSTKKTVKSATATDKQFNSLVRAWDKANEDARLRFVEVVGLGG